MQTEPRVACTPDNLSFCMLIQMRGPRSTFLCSHAAADMGKSTQASAEEGVHKNTGGQGRAGQTAAAAASGCGCRSRCNSRQRKRGCVRFCNARPVQVRLRSSSAACAAPTTTDTQSQFSSICCAKFESSWHVLRATRRSFRFDLFYNSATIGPRSGGCCQRRRRWPRRRAPTWRRDRHRRNGMPS